MSALYNEIDPYAAQWLRNLISSGLIAPGDVNESSIVDLRPDDVRGYAQVHFFAGIGVWSYALRRAGWIDERPVWTWSEPCQPFSAAGQGKGFADERYLRPYVHHLVSVCRPARCFGEQVASKDGLAWLDVVQSDMEGAGYAFAAFDLCAAGFGAPHIRQRIYFHAKRLPDADGGNASAEGLQRSGEQRFKPQDGGSLCVVDAEGFGLHGRSNDEDGRGWQRASGQGRQACELEHAARDGRDEWRTEPGGRSIAGGCGSVELVDALGAGLEGHSGYGHNSGQPGWLGAQADGSVGPAGPTDGERPGPTNGFWRDADWLGCTDGKWRPVEPGSFPLVDGTAFRLGSGSAFEGKARAKMLKGFGNAINAEHAAEFIGIVMECAP